MSPWAAARRRVAGDEGVSLVELLIVMMMSAIIIAAVGFFFTNVARHTTESIDVRSSTADASNIMNVVSTTVRGAVPVETAPKPDGTPNPPKPAIITAGSYSVTLLSYTDAGPAFPVPLQIRYRVDDDGRMLEDRWVANGCDIDDPSDCTAQYPTYRNPATTTPDATRVLGTIVVNVSDCGGAPSCQLEPLFRYYDICGNQLGSDAGGAQTSIPSVAWIEFNVRVHAADSKEDVRLVNRVGLGNLGNRIPQGGCGS